MKILEINSVCGIRSTGRICTDLHDILIANGNECKIAYGREAVPEKYQLDSYKIGSDLDVKIHGIESRIFGFTGFYSKNSTKKFLKWVDEFQPDVIHLHNLHGYYINVELLFDYLKKKNIPVVWTLHDCWSLTGHCACFAEFGCEKWKKQCDNCAYTKSYPQCFLPYSVKDNFEKKKNCFTGVKNLVIVTPSIWLANLVKQSFLKEYPVEVINNGIDISVFHPVKSDFRERNNLVNKKIILAVASSWGKSKGLGDYIKLSEMLNENEKIVLVGLTKEQMKNIPSKILCIERTNSTRELAEIYTTSDVFLNFTYDDNYPTVNLEARACGTPVVTYKTGGSPESAGENGIVVEQGNIEEALNVIRNNDLNCDENIENLSNTARFKKYLEIYNKI